MSKSLKCFADIDRFLSTLPSRTRSFEDRIAYIKSCLVVLGNPQDRAPSIHIAGTSGKGSTAYYASALLVEAGYSVGTIVSPHVSCVAERSQINGRSLPELVYCDYFLEFSSIVSKNAFEFTYIEFLTVFSYWLFARLGAEYIVVEVGLGGRLDPTNVISRHDKICVITSIGFDHVELLGDTLSKIAGEKAGIINRGSCVLSYNQDTEIMDAICGAASTNNAAFTTVPRPRLSKKTKLPYYQQFNYHLALQAVILRLNIDQKTPVPNYDPSSAKNTRIPGRYERFTLGSKTILLDGAHNSQKISALVDSLYAEYGAQSLVVVVSFGKKKSDAVKESMIELSRVAKHVVLTEFQIDFDESFKALDTDTLLTLVEYEAGVEVEKDPFKALALARDIAEKENLDIVVTGSFYLVSNIRSSLPLEH